MIEDLEKLEEFLNNNDEFKKKFDANKKIIDFNFIPDKFVKIFNKVAKEIFI